jgi:hypothetical protein
VILSETRRAAPSLCGGSVDSRAIALKTKLSFLKPGLARLHGFISSNELGNPMNLEALVVDVIRPALKEAQDAAEIMRMFEGFGSERSGV